MRMFELSTHTRVIAIERRASPVRLHPRRETQLAAGNTASLVGPYRHPLAIKVMQEVGLDLSAQRSKPLSEFLQTPVQIVVTVCSQADQDCPIFPGQVHRHRWPFDDPAKATGTEAEVLAAFRRVRNEIRRVFEAYAAGWRDARPG